ncbi:hypothetical protein NPIL_71731 [Nephila pilipes]|uniref:Uncharacterized protein n=1 Tax=Nephila pilipes TaxID=299642 RepID=A0A8X6TXY7_NEPPI|nr:hypothetical protein NPIL_71731 [Nephila pilipes]
MNKKRFPKAANSIPSAQYDWNGCHLDDRICGRGLHLGDRRTPLCPINGGNQVQISLVHDIASKTFGRSFTLTKPIPDRFSPHVTK